MANGPGPYKEFFLYKYFYFLNVCPFDYTAFGVSRKVGISYTDLTTPVRLQ